MRRRQNRAPVRHERLIGAVEAPELGLIVGESLLAGEQFRVAGEAGVDGIAPAVDDARVRQDEPDHARKQEVRGHLVDHVPPSGRHRLDEGEIGLAERLSCVAGKSRAERGNPSIPSTSV